MKGETFGPNIVLSFCPPFQSGNWDTVEEEWGRGKIAEMWGRGNDWPRGNEDRKEGKERHINSP